MTMTDIDLNAATIMGLSKHLRTRALSPVDLVAATLERIDALQPTLQCFTTLTPERAMQRAREAEREIATGQYRGPLHGIPYTLKDVIATPGIRTTFGDPKGTDYHPQEHATLYTLLEEAGGILVGKTVSEIGRDSMGPVGCRNPWHPECSPGTSSSGSGAAVAASPCGPPITNLPVGLMCQAVSLSIHSSVLSMIGNPCSAISGNRSS